MRASTKPKQVKFTHQRKRYKFPSLVLAAKHFNIPVVPVYQRMRKGWKVRLALVTPLRACKVRAYKPNPEVAAFYIDRATPISLAKH